MEDYDFDTGIFDDGEIVDNQDEANEEIALARERMAERGDIRAVVAAEISACMSAMAEISGFPLGDATKAKARLAASRAALAYLQALLAVDGAEAEVRRLLEGVQGSIDRQSAEARRMFDRAVRAEKEAAAYCAENMRLRAQAGATDVVDLLAAPEAPKPPPLPPDVAICLQAMRTRGTISGRPFDRRAEQAEDAWKRLDDAGRVAVALASGARNALPSQYRAYGDMQLWGLLPEPLRRAVLDEIAAACAVASASP